MSTVCSSGLSKVVSPAQSIFFIPEMDDGHFRGRLGENVLLERCTVHAEQDSVQASRATVCVNTNKSLITQCMFFVFCMSSWTNLCPVPGMLSLAMEELGRPADCCVLWSSDGLSCSNAHFLFSICPHGLEAFFSLQLHEIIEIGGLGGRGACLFSAEKTDSFKALSFLFLGSNQTTDVVSICLMFFGWFTLIRVYLCHVSVCGCLSRLCVWCLISALNVSPCVFGDFSVSSCVRDLPLPPFSAAGPQPFSSFVAALCSFSFFLFPSLLSSFCTGEHTVWFNIIFQSPKAAGQGLLTELFRSS